MPNLAKADVEAWLREMDPLRADALCEDGPAEISAAVEAAVRRMGNALDAALKDDAGLLAGRLGGDPFREELRAIVAQLSTARFLQIMSWMLHSGLPRGDATLRTLMGHDSAGNGQYLQAVLLEANRPTLVSRIYAPDRLEAVQQACADLSSRKEAA